MKEEEDVFHARRAHGRVKILNNVVPVHLVMTLKTKQSRISVRNANQAAMLSKRVLVCVMFA